MLFVIGDHGMTGTGTYVYMYISKCMIQLMINRTQSIPGNSPVSKMVELTKFQLTVSLEFSIYF